MGDTECSARFQYRENDHVENAAKLSTNVCFINGEKKSFLILTSEYFRTCTLAISDWDKGVESVLLLLPECVFLHKQSLNLTVECEYVCQLWRSYLISERRKAAYRVEAT